MSTIPMTQHVRNQLSLLAWLFAAACAWLLFMSAAAAAQHVNEAAPVSAVASSSAVATAQITSAPTASAK